MGTPGAIDDLFQLPLADFTAARNALVTKLKQSGEAEDAERVKAIPKPPLSAWVVNQLYWRHRKAFDQAVDAGEQFRKAQSAQLQGKSADLRATLDARREALSELSGLAREILRESGHPSQPDMMRRITTTLEALTAYGRHVEAPSAGRLALDVDPPGFEALASLVPRGDGSRRERGAPTRVIPFSQSERQAPKQKLSPEEAQRRHAAEERKKQAEARKALVDAERELQSAKRAAERARLAMKNAAATAREQDKAKAALEARLEQVSSAAEAARQEARRVASDAENAAQAVDDAERAVVAARETLKNLR